MKIPPALLFSLRIALTLHGLCGSIQISEWFFYQHKKCHWNLDRDRSESIDGFGHFNSINSYKS